MNDLAVSAAWGVAIAASLIGGALAAARLHLPERVAATLSALGGGILLAAVALELVPEADERAGASLTALGLLSGTLLYVGADSWLTRDRGMEMMRRSGHAAASGKPMSMASCPGGGRRFHRRLPTQLDRARECCLEEFDD